MVGGGGGRHRAMDIFWKSRVKGIILRSHVAVEISLHASFLGGERLYYSRVGTGSCWTGCRDGL